MKNPGEAVYTAIYSALNGNVTDGSTILPVYSVVPDAVGSGYVFVSEFDATENDLKDRFMWFGNVQIQIVLPQLGPKESARPLQRFADTLVNALKPNVNSTLDLSPNFSNTYLYPQSIRDFQNLFDDDRTIRKVVQLVLGIEEL